ncbi:unnamed protein product [Closterium sp. NIES-54]
MSLEVWKVTHGPASARAQTHSPTDSSTATFPLLAEIDEAADEDVEEVHPTPPPPVPTAPFVVADLPEKTPSSAPGDEGSLRTLPVALSRGIASGRRDVKLVDEGAKPSTAGELRVEKMQQTGEPLTKEASAEEPSTREQFDDGSSSDVVEVIGAPDDDEGELSAREQSTDSDVVEVKADEPPLRRSTRLNFGKPREKLSYHACLPPTSYSTLLDDAQDDVDLPELDRDVHADPEHRWDIATMTVKEALASWKGKAVKAAMDEEIRSLIANGTWELVERPRGVNIMKNRWVLTTKYHIDDTVSREKARLVVKGFTQVYGADYEETYAPVSSYVTLRIFLSIVAVRDLHLMQLDMKNAFLQSKLDRVLYMYQPDYYDDGTGRVCKLLKSLYGLKQSPLLWYRALDGVPLGAGWKKSQVDEALYFKAGDGGVMCWVLVYVDDLLAASSSLAMLKELKELKELLEAAFELREISPVERRFIDEEQTERISKTPVSVDAYAELTFDDEDAQAREEEEYRQMVGSLQFAATTTRPDIAFAWSKLGSGLTVWSDNQWREVDHCLHYPADTRDTALEFGGGPESLCLVGYVDAGRRGRQAEPDEHRCLCVQYVAATEAGKEARRLRFLLAEFKLLDPGMPTVLRVDNQSAITVAEGLGLKGNLKHMEQRYAWLQQMVKRGKIVLKYIPTSEQPADFLTKGLHFPAFNRCSIAIGQVRLADVGDGDDDVRQ